MQHNDKNTLRIDAKDTIDKALLEKVRNARCETLEIFEIDFRQRPQDLEKILTEARNNPRIKHWKLNEINFYGRESILSEAIKNARYLECLNFPRSLFNLSSEELIASLTLNQSIRELLVDYYDLNNVGMENTDFFAIAKIIKSNPRIEKLFLGNGLIFSESMKVLRESIVGHPALKTFILDRVGFVEMDEEDDPTPYPGSMNDLVMDFITLCIESRFQTILVKKLYFWDHSAVNHIDKEVGNELLKIIFSALRQNRFLTEVDFSAIADNNEMYDLTDMLAELKKQIQEIKNEKLAEVKAQKIAFMSGMHNRLGQDSSIKKDFKGNKIFDRNVIRDIFALMGSEGVDSEINKVSLPKQISSEDLKTINKSDLDHKKINLNQADEAIIIDLHRWINRAMLFQEKLKPYKPPATGVLSSASNLFRNEDDELTPEKRKEINGFLGLLDKTLTEIQTVLPDMKEEKDVRDALFKIIGLMDSAKFTKIKGTVITQLTLLVSALKTRFPKQEVSATAAAYLHPSLKVWTLKIWEALC